jgi:2',3'-cyclic-nucleotide 2'-phosphodiesterase / 3'-nucleotidase / 5'-nucleotidase
MPSINFSKNLKKLLILACFFNLMSIANAQVNLQFLGRFSVGYYDKAAAEISAYDPGTKRLFVANSADTSIKIVDLSNPSNPVQISSISLKPYGIDLNSVACRNGIVATCVIDSLGKTVNGKVVFFNTNGTFLKEVRVGANPDMVTFSKDGKRAVVANEGEPSNYRLIDPVGSVSIIDLSNGIANLTQANVATAGFESFNNQTIDFRIKITGRVLDSAGNFLRNSTVAEDLEPEYVSISDDGNIAWVTCQENNCIAEVNLNTATVTKLIPLGFKNHQLAANKLDASDQGGVVNFANWPVFGMYQPDAISSYKRNGVNYLVTANEGDVRADWGSANNEEVRFGNASYQLDTNKFGGAAAVAALKANTALGRLTVSNKYGDFNKDGLFDSIFCFGARSFSIWDATSGQLVFDSKDDFEKITLAAYPANFNASSTNNTLKNRSDDKGPEPEALTIGVIGDSTYAFIGLERIGGIMVYNITNPTNAYFVQYINTRNFAQTPGLNSGGDLAPEGIEFVPAGESPDGKPMLIVSNEVSGTVSIFRINAPNTFKLQVLHSSDMESGLSAVIDAPNFAAIVDKLEDEYPNTLILSSGDNTLPGPFLSSGEDPSLQTPLRNTASSYFGGNGNQLRAAIGRPDIAIMNIIGYNASALGNHEFDLGTTELNGQIGVDIRNNGSDKRWIGAQFPYVSCNLNFSADANLNYLFTNQVLRDIDFKTPANITSNNQKKGISPSVIIERNGEKIGVVGITTQILAKISSPGATSVVGPQVDDMPALAAIMQPFIDTLRNKGINKIIVLSHLQQLSNEVALAPLLKGVDILIAGGNHQLLADGNDRIRPGQSVFGTYPIKTTNNDGDPLLILNSSAEWRYVNRLVVEFDSVGKVMLNSLDSVVNGAYASDTAMVTSLYGTYSSAFLPGSKGANVRTLCAAIGNVINSKDGNILGKSNVFLEGRRNLVRTEETNLGNLSSDANLWYAQKYDAQVKVSLKNGGGIRSAIGFVNAVGDQVSLEPNQANASANKLAGSISQLDVEGSLRFNNSLVIVSTNAAGLKRLLEHGISATRPGQTPGQFPQVGGVAFSFDTTLALGSRIRSMVIIDSLGNRQDTIVRNGMLHGDTARVYKIVTLNFLANPSGAGSPVGGDGYPFPSNISGRVNLDTAIKVAGTSSFAAIGSEQDAFAEYMLAKHAVTPYTVRDTTVLGDRRIQQLNMRKDAIFPETNPAITIQEARLTAAPNLVRVRGVVSKAWGRFIYIQDQNAGIGVRQSSGAMVDAIAAGALKEGDSVEVIGPRNEFNNYAQIQLNSGAYTGANIVTVLGSNRKINPIHLTVKQVYQSPEAYESRLIRISGLRSSGSGNFAASTNYNFWDGTTAGDTIVFRVISAADTEIEDAPALSIPKDTFTFEGILAQFCSSPANGCTNGYQLYGVRKADIIVTAPPAPVLKNFNLVSPSNNASVTVTAGSTDLINIIWTGANANNYKWMATLPVGSFTAPLLVNPSNNAGKDTVLTLTSGLIDNILAGAGLGLGDSIQLKWTVFGYLAADSLKASQDFFITLKRNRVLTPFALIAPANNARVVTKETDNTPVNITWEASNGATNYRWFLDVPSGNFSTPIISLPANNAGVNNNLTLTVSAIDGVAKNAGVAEGDSVLLKWTVKAYTSNDSLFATQAFNVLIVREKFVGLANVNGAVSMAVYPNPATESFDIKAEASLIGSTITLTDIFGKKVLATTYEGNAINVSDVSKGLYLVLVETKQGVYTSKLIIE